MTITELEPLPSIASDEAISRAATPRPIEAVALDAGLLPQEIEPYGRSCAKVSVDAIKRLSHRLDGRLILVTAVTPTKAGEGKTVTTIGLAQAFHRLGIPSIACLRQPSQGPVFGVKGCATGTGYAQLLPREDINLHLTGDFHAIQSAHNLLAACADNLVNFGNHENIERLTWRRTLDVCDRQLRDIEIGRGGKANGWPHTTGFDITAASEIMAIMALCDGVDDLRKRLSDIIIGWRNDGTPVRAAAARCIGSMLALLKNAMRPNLVQTLEGSPVLVHCGPFGNIAHGCNSLAATRLGLKLADYVITEAGFGSDLGAEKFLDIKCRNAGIAPSAAVLVASVRALKLHGLEPGADPTGPNPAAVERGLANLQHHAENLQAFRVPVVIAANRFPDDTAEELALIADFAQRHGCRFAISEVAARGGAGGEDLAREVFAAAADGPVDLRHPYELTQPIQAKVEALAKRVYQADGVDWAEPALAALAEIERAGLGSLPICMAKTQSSITDDPKKTGAPRGWRLSIRDVKVSAGAGFIIVLTGKMQLMPGLPERGRYELIDLDAEGLITGLA